jgi:ribonuclease HI
MLSHCFLGSDMMKCLGIYGDFLILKRVGHQPTPHPQLDTQLHTLDLPVFFYGGSRENPGAGGSGACIVVYEAGRPHVLWAQATCFADPTTTRNVAELAGALIGLRTLRSLRSLSPPVCSIIGDSDMLLSLFRRHKLPKTKHLRGNSRQARRIADSLPIHDWNHHLRAHNSMADLLANYAMDTRTMTSIWASSS